MEIYTIVGDCTLIVAAIALLLFLYWRYVWFFRNPNRVSPQGESLVSPADGTVVYVKKVEPHEEVIVLKQGISASINDIIAEDVVSPKILIGIFMSPFNVHYNRAPLMGRVRLIRHHPAKGRNVNMSPMHFRTILRRPPFYRNSLHIIQNERTVTKLDGSFKGNTVSCYVIQIAGGSVSGIESHVHEDDLVRKGSIIGMIRIGSQVDLVVSSIEGMKVRVGPGDKVRAGETVIID